MVSTGSRKGLFVEEILATTCTDTLPDRSSDVLSEGDDNADNGSYGDFELDIERKNKENCTSLV
jgi:hypothetical protein